MKKFTLSVATVLAMSTFAVAGGDMKEVEPVVSPVAEVIAPSEGSFYVGAGYSRMKMEKDWGDYQYDAQDMLPFMGGVEKVTENAVLLLAGYNFNRYLAVEGRYTMGIGDLETDSPDYPNGGSIMIPGNMVNGGMSGEFEGDISNIGLYLKPMYPIGAVNIYGLLGYGQVSVEEPPYDVDGSESGFQWGLGASYTFNQNFGVFVDYTRLYDDKGFDGFDEPYNEVDFVIDSINVGVTYTF